MNHFDMEKPTITKDQLLCDGCWKVAERKTPGWVFLKFRFLQNVDLCPECSAGEHGVKCLLLQEQGL